MRRLHTFEVAIAIIYFFFLSGFPTSFLATTIGIIEVFTSEAVPAA
jgi:hypothetical protein